MVLQAWAGAWAGRVAGVVAPGACCLAVQTMG